MNSISKIISFSTEGVNQTALRDYKTYLDHYSLKNLDHMSFDEFLENYIG